MMPKLGGVIAPITTPFLNDGSIALDKLEDNVRIYAESGIHGYLALGSNGENKSLTYEEKLEVVRCIEKNKSADQFVMVGSIFESTKETICFAKQAQELGADYISLLPPSYFKSQMKDAELIGYFTDVANAVSIPCTLYNAPQYAGGLALGLGVITECAKHSNVVGIKDSSGGGIEKILAAVPEDFRVLSGSANTFVNALINGAVGGVVSLANSLPETVLDVYNAFLREDYPTLRALNKAMIRLNAGVAGNYGVAGVKYAMDRNGFYGGIPRLPLLPLTEEACAKIDDALARYVD